MISFPNAKVNLGLYITEKRPDGYHNIETVFLPVPSLCDILEVIPAIASADNICFSQSGIAVDGSPENNLCVKAYHLLSKYAKLPPVAMHLHKQIPMGAGLGGGSADGAFALKMLNQLAESPLDISKLEKLALELGSDCPFFLKNATCHGAGQGNILTPLALNLKGYHILIVNPNIHVGTAEAYKECTPQPAPLNLIELAEVPVGDWKSRVSNDFEKTVFAKSPEIGEIKTALYRMGAVYASMSGSGSTVFGLFETKPEPFAGFERYYIHLSEL